MSVETVPSFIGGSFREGVSEEVDPIPNPATGETIALLPYSTAEEIDEAVRAAAEALPDWADAPVPDRAQVLFRFKQLLEERFEELAALVTRENGKTLAESRGEVRRAIEVVDFACGAPTLLMGTNLDQIADGIDEELVRFPVGVCVGITPFNFPNMVPLWMVPVALACGNTFVLKPSQRTPLSAVRIAELLQAAGLPDGVFNVVHGAREAVDRLLAHPDVAAVSFVGSAGVARYVYATAAANGKRVQALGELALDGAHDVHDLREALDDHELGRPDRPRRAHAAEVVAGEVDEHRVLGPLLRVGEELVLVQPVAQLGRAPRAGAGDRPGRDRAPLDAHERLG